MKNQRKESVIHAALQVPFNEANFFEMVREILKNVPDDKRDRFDRKGAYIYNDFSPYVTRFQRIGKYVSPDKKRVDILIVHLKKETSLERARTMQRNFVAKYLKDDKGGGIKHAALVAFVSPNGTDWRLSFVKMEWKFDDNGEPVPELSPARRYSFLIEENSHTAQSRLLLAHTNPTLGQLETAFSVEPVTDEFFEEYRELFFKLKELLDDIVVNNEKVKEDFAVRDIEPADFAKKLLGQIVFLYFLQKKGWFGVPRDEEWGAGSQKFLRELFEKEHGDYQNFFNDILEPLFYNTLAIKRHQDWEDRFQCRIPFLNGGLFDPLNEYDWVNVDILLPDHIFTNDNGTKEGDSGDGILDVFDRYNFTVNENEPLEKEVAVDPEMLGKVFENLLKVKDRKSSGTYYTPREIVHYMCRESLANYLATELEGKVTKADIEDLLKYGKDVAENESRVVREGRQTDAYKYQLPDTIRENAELIDDKLASIRACDPAVGSGAFPVGMMNEIVGTRNALTAYIGENGVRSPYHFKRRAIEYSIYGVDIDPGAVEIAKLRLWLSLIVDEEDRNVIKPLPNLDYRIIRGDSLLGMENFLSDPDKAEQLKKLQRYYIRETDIDAKLDLRKQIDELLYEMDTVQDSDVSVEFSFRRHFLEVFDDKDGFDVVIGNPPYIQLQKESGKLAKRYKKNGGVGYESFTRTGDIYALFYECGHKLLAPEGHLCYITSHQWLRAEHGKNLRIYLSNRTRPQKLIDFQVKVFEAGVDVNILLLGKRPIDNPELITRVIKDLRELEADTDEPRKIGIPKDGGSWFIPSAGSSDAELRLKDRVEKIGTPLKEWEIKISYGIKTGYNPAFIITAEKRRELLANCSDESEHQRTDALIKPLLRGKNIDRYSFSWKGEYIIVVPAGWTDRNRAKQGAERFFENNYPQVYRHLKSFKQAPKKGKGLINREDKGDYWWELRPCDYYSEFLKEKLVYSRITAGPRFFMDASGFYVLDTTFIMTCATHKTLSYLCGVLNSNFGGYIFKKYYAGGELGSMYEYRKQFLSRFHMPAITDSNRALVHKIGDLVGRITSSKEKNPNTDTSEHEKQIDKLVYDLYDLTPDEIEIIKEGNNPK